MSRKVYQGSVYQFICLWRFCLSIHMSMKALSINSYVYKGSIYKFICLWRFCLSIYMSMLVMNSYVYDEGSIHQFKRLWRFCLWRFCLSIYMSMKGLSMNSYVYEGSVYQYICLLSVIFFCKSLNKIQEYLSTDIFNYLSKLCYPSTYLPNYLPILLSIYLSWPVSFTYPAIRSVSTVALIGTCRIYTIHTLY